MTEHDPVNHPTHYASDATCSGCGTPIECIDVVRHHRFDRGNALKYLWRAGAKGDLVEDLKKAIWYIQDEIAEAEGITNPNVHRLNKPVGEILDIRENDDGISILYKTHESFDKDKCLIVQKEMLVIDGWKSSCNYHNRSITTPHKIEVKSCADLIK